jgi:hypothetical protein
MGDPQNERRIQDLELQQQRDRLFRMAREAEHYDDLGEVLDELYEVFIPTPQQEQAGGIPNLRRAIRVLRGNHNPANREFLVRDQRRVLAFINQDFKLRHPREDPENPTDEPGQMEEDLTEDPIDPNRGRGRRYVISDAVRHVAF